MSIDNLDGVTVELVHITPELATSYLATNFEFNRKAYPDWIDELRRDMRTGRFVLSNDIICFDRQGHLVNGQHRLNAVIASGTAQPFFVAHNMPDRSVAIIDTGKRRAMFQRITVSGTPMTLTECSVIRHAMANIGQIGTTQFAHTSTDDRVKRAFVMHRDFFTALRVNHLSKKNISALFIAAGLKMYAQMMYRLKKEPNHVWDHEMRPWERCVHWIQVTNDALVDTRAQYDSAALRLRQIKAERKATANQQWNDVYAKQVTLTAAYHFMLGNGITKLHRATKDPFTALENLPTTNEVAHDA